MSVECLHSYVSKNVLSTLGAFWRDAFNVIHSPLVKDVAVSNGNSTLLADKFLKVAGFAVQVVIEKVELIWVEGLCTVVTLKVLRMPILSHSFNHDSRSDRLLACVALSSTAIGGYLSNGCLQT